MTRADLEKRLAEAMVAQCRREAASPADIWEHCARIAADEIEKANADWEAYLAKVQAAWVDVAAAQRMDAARKMVDHVIDYLTKRDAARFALPYFDSFQDSDIARIIGADGHEDPALDHARAMDEWHKRKHEGGGEASGSRDAAQPSPLEMTDEVPVSGQPGVSGCGTAEPPRPYHDGTWESARDYYTRKARAAAFEECAKIAELYAENWRQGSFHTLHSAVSNVAAAIRAAARKGE